MSNFNPADFELLSRMYRYYESENQRINGVQQSAGPRYPVQAPAPTPLQAQAQRPLRPSIQPRPLLPQHNSPLQNSPNAALFQMVTDTKKRVDDIYWV